MPYKRIEVHNCPYCKTPVVIPPGLPGAVCPRCRQAVLVEDIQRQPEPASGLPYLRLALILLIVGLVGVLLYIALWDSASEYWVHDLVANSRLGLALNLEIEPGLDVIGQPRVTNDTPRHFSLWELHADDSVRLVEVTTQHGAAGGQGWFPGPMFQTDDQALSLAPIGGQIVSSNIAEEAYRQETYARPYYALQISGEQFGFDLRMSHLPHLHANGNDRLISIGVDPKSYVQEIIAVAIPVGARLTGVYDYKPYRHITLSNWDIFYYDVTRIPGHVSIHISYRPAGDPSSLNWVTVEAQR